MHELGVVFHVIKTVNRIAAENGVRHVCAVTIELGEVSAVIPAYLEDCWKWAVSKETVMKDAALIIEPIKAETFCEDCKGIYGTVAHGKTCPYCGSGHTYLLRGNEFILKNITTADDLPNEEPAGEPSQKAPAAETLPETGAQTAEETARGGE